MNDDDDIPDDGKGFQEWWQDHFGEAVNIPGSAFAYLRDDVCYPPEWMSWSQRTSWQVPVPSYRIIMPWCPLGAKELTQSIRRANAPYQSDRDTAKEIARYWRMSKEEPERFEAEMVMYALHSR